MEKHVKRPINNAEHDLASLPISWLPIGLPLPCDLYLLFEGGKKKLRWRAKGDVLDEQELHKIDCVHVESSAAPGLLKICEEIPLRARTDEGLLISAVLRDDTTDPTARRILVEEIAMQVLEEGLQKTETKEIHLWQLKIKNIFMDVSEIGLGLTQDWLSILRKCEQSGKSRGNLETAALALLMALASGQIETQALSDLGVAAFFGEMAAPFSGLTQKTVHAYGDDDWVRFKQAGQATPAVFKQIGFQIQGPSILLLTDHHATRLRNPKLQPISHPLTCAILWSWFANGKWDSHLRSPQETWAALNLLDNMQALPYSISPNLMNRLRSGLGDPSVQDGSMPVPV